MTLQHQRSSRYRPDLDGLRALAVAIVILFHFGVECFSGGYVGVDVFFVISGYLISQKLVAAHQQGGISFSEFYAGRIRRLLPALYATLSIVMLAALFVMPFELRRLGVSTLAALGWVANVLFWSQAGYWDPGWLTKPLLHVWSLSVEEQFYFVWPALTALALRRGTQRFVYVVFGIAGIVSLGAAEWMLARSPESAFYFMPFRGFEFAFGGLCLASDAPSWLRYTQKRPGLREALSSTGLVLMMFAALSFDEHTAFPGLTALVPCLGASLVIVARRAPLTGALLTTRPSVYIGLISYSLYLTHWPLLVFFHESTRRLPEAGEIAALLLATFALSATLFRFVETPLRQSKLLGAGSTRPRIGPALLFASVPAVAIAGLAGILVLTDGLAFRYRDEIRAIATTTGADVLTARHARLEAKCGSIWAERCGSVDPTRSNVLILGDSNGPDTLNALAEAFPDTNFIVWWTLACPPLIDLEGQVFGEAKCEEINEQRWKDLPSQRALNAIVLSLRIPKRREAAVENTVEFLSQRGYRVHVVGPGLRFDTPLQQIAAEHQSLVGLDQVADGHALRHQFASDERLANFVEQLGGEYISKRAFFCPDKQPCRAVTSSGKSLLIFDQEHLSAAGAAEFALFVRARYPSLFDPVSEPTR